MFLKDCYTIILFKTIIIINDDDDDDDDDDCTTNVISCELYFIHFRRILRKRFIFFSSSYIHVLIYQIITIYIAFYDLKEIFKC